MIGWHEQREFITDCDIKFELEEVGQRKNPTLSLERAGGFFRPAILMLSVNLFYLIDQAEAILGSIVVDNLVLAHQTMSFRLLGKHD